MFFVDTGTAYVIFRTGADSYYVLSLIFDQVLGIIFISFPVLINITFFNIFKTVRGAHYGMLYSDCLQSRPEVSEALEQYRNMSPIAGEENRR